MNNDKYEYRVSAIKRREYHLSQWTLWQCGLRPVSLGIIELGIIDGEVIGS
jgi:hypothetical protein